MAQRNKKFLFDRSFDDPNKLYMPGERRRSEMTAAQAAEAAVAAAKVKLPHVELAPAAPEISPEEKLKAQMDAAREEGYVQGHAAALEEAETTREHYVADAINLIAKGMEKVVEQQRAAYGQVAEEGLRMVYAVVRKLLPPIVQNHAADTIGEFVKEVLPLATSEPQLVIRAHSMIVEDLDRRLQEVMGKSGFRGTFNVVADHELQPGDCRIDWEGGGADRDEVRIWRNIRESMAASFGDIDADGLDVTARSELPPSSIDSVSPDEPG